MKLTPINPDLDTFPTGLRPLLSNAALYDSSCSPEARVIYIDKDGGFFLKTAARGALEREHAMTRYFSKKGLAPKALAYMSSEQDWLLTEKLGGDDCTAARYMDNPKRLCDEIAMRLRMLHEADFADCPIQNHTELFCRRAQRNRAENSYDRSHFPDSFGYTGPEEAWRVIETKGHLLENNTLLHGDYCLPNIILDNWRFSGFIDLDNAGVGDRHVDIFWGIWTLSFNLKTDIWRRRFMDAYGGVIDEERLRIVAAYEVFG